jgi:hypothetical protein
MLSSAAAASEREPLSGSGGAEQTVAAAATAWRRWQIASAWRSRRRTTSLPPSCGTSSGEAAATLSITLHESLSCLVVLRRSGMHQRLPGRRRQGRQLADQ